MSAEGALAFGGLLESGAVLSSPFWESFCAGLEAQPLLARGERLGPWRVLEEIGHGGMSVVYLVERADDAFRRRAALKVLDRAPRDREARARFEQERQILASLDHPNIARLLDGGVDGRGLPYLVLELVDGQPLDRYCEERDLSVDERIALVQVVARAVAHAHRRLVIHRDLKPSNLLVTASGEVKLLDFGIAKLLGEGAGLPFAAPPTRTALRVMTPEYASPEQVRGEPVTTASDVYQLGLILFELLTGKRAHGLTGESLAEMERVVCEQPLPRPSRVASGAARSRRLSGDLDAIVGMALRKEPDRRYASPADLAADLERYRTGQPVAAREEGLLYRAGKLVRRHRLAVAASAAIVLSLAGGLGAALWQAREARLEAQKATAVKDFLVDLFQGVSPGELGARPVTARELLDRGVGRLGALREPGVQADLLTAAGTSYFGLGHYGRARQLLEQAFRLERREQGEQSLEVAELETRLALLAYKAGETKRSEAFYRAALATRRALLPPADPRIAENLAGLGSCLLDYDQDAQAARLLEEALALLRQGPHPDPTQVGGILNDLGMLRHRALDLAGAERLYRESLALQRRAHGPIHPESTTPLHNLGALLKTQGRLTEAEAVFREVIRLETQLYGGDHPTTADSWGYLGHTLRAKGDRAEAEAAYRRCLAINQARRGPRHFATLSAYHNLGRLLLETGRAGEAEPLVRKALAGRIELYGPDYRKTKESRELLEKCRAALS